MWTKKANYPSTGKYGTIGFAHGSTPFIGAGGSGNNLFKDFYSYNDSWNKWDTVVAFPGSARKQGVGFSIIHWGSGAGYVGLGWNDSISFYDFYKYDFWTNSWSQVANYPGVAGNSCFGASTERKGYVGGGYNGTGTQAQSDWWEYNPDSNSWRQLSSFPFGGREGGVCFSIGCEIFVGLGSNGSTTYKDIWAYNVHNDTWTQKTNFPGTSRSHASSMVVNGHAIIGGGHLPSTGAVFNDYYSYDPLSDTWTSIPGFSGGKRTMSQGIGGRRTGHIALGQDSNGVALNDLWEYTDTVCVDRLYQFCDDSCGRVFYSLRNSYIDSSGLYIDTGVTSFSLCDSIIYLCFQYKPEYIDTIKASGCDSLISPTGKWYTKSGIYHEVLKTFQGCDSTIRLELTIPPVPTFKQRFDFNSISLLTPTDTVQWLDCDSGMRIIPGANKSTYIPIKNGNYAAVVTKNGCTDTSECIDFYNPFLVIEKFNENIKLLYPNPTKNKIHVDLVNEYSKIHVELFDSKGRLVKRQTSYSTNSIEIEINGSPGIYFVRLSGMELNHSFKILKE